MHIRSKNDNFKDNKVGGCKKHISRYRFLPCVVTFCQFNWLQRKESETRALKKKLERESVSVCVLPHVRVIMNRERVSVNACDDLTKGVCMLVCVCEYECGCVRGENLGERESVVIK